MNSFRTILLALMLLIGQSFIGLSSSRVMCLSLGTCMEPEVAANCCCDSESGVHEHGSADHDTRDHNDCTCHLHLPVPSESKSPPQTVRVSVPEMPMIAIIDLSALLDWSPRTTLGTANLLRPPNDTGGERTCSLRTTRLLI